MKIYRNIVIIVGIVLGILLAIWHRFDSPRAKIAFDSSFPEMDQEYLKSIALEFANGNEPILAEGISAEYELNAKTFRVVVSQEVRGIKNFYTLIATFPIVKVDVRFEDGSVNGIFAIEADNGSYSYYGNNDNTNKNQIRESCAIIAFMVPFFLWFFLCWLPTETKELAKSTKRQLREEDFQ